MGIWTRIGFEDSHLAPLSVGVLHTATAWVRKMKENGRNQLQTGEELAQIILQCILLSILYKLTTAVC